MDREAIAYMLFISSALYLKERNIKPFCQEALYIYCKRWHLLHRKVASNDTKRWHLLQQKMPPFASTLLLMRMKGINDMSERNMGFIT